MTKTLLVLDEKQKCGLCAAKEALLQTVNIFGNFQTRLQKTGSEKVHWVMSLSMNKETMLS